MSILVDNETADNEIVAEPGTVAEPQAEKPSDFAVPEKFRGKSAEDIAKSYVELEKELGRVRNDVGDYRSLTDRLLQLEEKRTRDLEGAGASPESMDIDPADFLTNPRESLTKWYEQQKKSDPEYRSLQDRLNRVESHYKTEVVRSKHADADELAQDPDFIAFVQAHPVRLQLAQAAVQQGNVDALDYLLTEYKERKGSRPEPKQASEASAARRVATERASSGSPAGARTGGDKVYSRRKLIQLKITNPDEYAAMQDQILLAYAQGRVTD